MVLHNGLGSTDDIEAARAGRLRRPNGAELLKHATCSVEKRWNQLLSRPIGTPLPFGELKSVGYTDAQKRGWLRDDVDDEALEGRVKEWENEGMETRIQADLLRKGQAEVLVGDGVISYRTVSVVLSL